MHICISSIYIIVLCRFYKDEEIEAQIFNALLKATQPVVSVILTTIVAVMLVTAAIMSAVLAV